MKSKLPKQVYVITKSYIIRLNKIGFIFAILFTPAFILIARDLSEEFSMFVQATIHPELHATSAAEQLKSLFTSFFYVTYFPGLTYVYMKYRYLSLPRTYLFPNYPKAIHWLTGLIYLVVSATLFYWCRQAGIEFSKAFAIIFIALTYVFLFTASDKAFYSIHTNYSPVFWCLIPIPYLFIFFPSLKLKVISIIQWYLFEDRYYYLVFFVTGTFAYVYNSFRINNYYQRMTALGYESTKDYQRESKVEQKNIKYQNIDQKRISLDRLFEREIPDCSTLDKSSKEERIRLWKAGNEKNASGIIWSMFAILFMSFFYLTLSKHRMNRNYLVFSSVVMILFMSSLSLMKITSWTVRLEFNPPEILKPVSKQNIIQDYFYNILKELFIILILTIPVILTLLFTFQHEQNSHYFLLYTFSSIFYFQSLLLWIAFQPKKKSDLSDYASAIIPATMLILFILISRLSSEDYIAPGYYMTLSMILILLGLCHYSSSYKLWKNKEWGAKG